MGPWFIKIQMNVFTLMSYYFHFCHQLSTSKLEMMGALKRGGVTFHVLELIFMCVMPHEWLCFHIIKPTAQTGVFCIY